MNILLINNYDSFVYNLYHLIGSVARESSIEIVNNDEITVEEASSYNGIIISPGPGIPSEAGRVVEIVQKLYATVPILGICLGHQAIAQAFGAEIYCLEQPLHGIKDNARLIDRSGLFRNLPGTISVGRYHSWMVSEMNLPDALRVTAIDNSGRIMALSHKKYNVHGIQFHPESIMTPQGEEVVANFIETCV